MRFQIHVTPKSRRESVEIEPEAGKAAGRGRIRVRVTAPPDEGRANEAVIALLAERLGLPRRSLRVAGGAASRTKWIEADGLEEGELWRRLGRRPGAE